LFLPSDCGLGLLFFAAGGLLLLGAFAVLLFAGLLVLELDVDAGLLPLVAGLLAVVADLFVAVAGLSAFTLLDLLAVAGRSVLAAVFVLPVVFVLAAALVA
jgi:hypothetical protein